MLDLHCHSTASDGLYTPAELATIAWDKRMLALALTDHDTIDGIADFLKRAEELRLAAQDVPSFLPIPGIEFSTRTKTEDHQKIHLIGLFINHLEPQLVEATDNLKHWREERIPKMLEKLAEHGCPLSLDDVLAFAKNSSIGRPHVADAMISKGYCANRLEAFQKYLGDSAPCYVPSRHYPVDECIKFIHQAGGIAIWAHPYSSASQTTANFTRILEDLLVLGLDGCEAYHPSHTITNTNNVLAVCKKYGIPCSGGSDCHGPRTPTRTIGSGSPTVITPDRILEDLKNKAAIAH